MADGRVYLNTPAESMQTEENGFAKILPYKSIRNAGGTALNPAFAMQAPQVGDEGVSQWEALAGQKAQMQRQGGLAQAQRQMAQSAPSTFGTQSRYASAFGNAMGGGVGQAQQAYGGAQMQNSLQAQQDRLGIQGQNAQMTDQAQAANIKAMMDDAQSGNKYNQSIYEEWLKRQQGR